MSFFGGLFNFLKIKKWPDRHQRAQFFKVLNKKEKIIFWSFFIIFLFSLSCFFIVFYFNNTKIAPARGGEHIEGVVGQPRFINPVYANSDTDRDLVQLVFSGLMKYNKNLGVEPDLAQKYDIEEGGRVYKFYLKEKLFWQDGIPITADDVVYTIKTIQNSEYKSPLQANWVGVEAEKIGDLAIKFTIKKPYAAFLDNCTVKIMPKHIWENISAENFPLSVYNLKPVASGPYKIKEMRQDRSDNISYLILTPNSYYFGQKPYISEIKFVFFDKKEDLIKKAKAGKIGGFTYNSSTENTEEGRDYYKMESPRYFALFLNPANSKLLSIKEVRIALNYGTDKEELIKEVFNGSDYQNKIVQSPILPEIYGFEQPAKIYEYNPNKAKDILDNAGFKNNGSGLRQKIVDKEPAFQFKSDLKNGSKGKEVEELQKCLAKFPDIYPEGEITGVFGTKTENAVNRFQEKYASEILQPSGLTEGTGAVKKSTRAKLNKICFPAGQEITPLKISLITVDQPELISVANIIKKQWEQIGVQLDIKTFPSSELEREYIKPRNYEILLFGEALGATPDPFPFWHSSQKNDPGLNLAVYENKDINKLLEGARESLDPVVRADKLNSFQNALIVDAPAVFLYSPEYIYSVSKKIKGISEAEIVDPSKRFIGVEDWHIRTSRRFAP